MNADPAILFVKPKAISRQDKRVLKEAGVIVVEIDDPQSVKFIRASVELSGGALLVAAAKAIKDTSSMNSTKEAFGRAVCAAIEAQLGTPTPTVPK